MSKLNIAAQVIGKTAGTARRLVLGSQTAAPQRPVHRRSVEWRYYKLDELGVLVSYYASNSIRRTDPIMKAKDLNTAQDYLNMMQAQIDGLREKK